MQRWFFLEQKRVKKPKPSKKMSLAKPENATAEVTSQEWVFTVTVQDLLPKETMFMTGNIDDLGQWDYTKMVALENQDCTNIWRKTVTIPNTCDVFYRYAICVIHEDTHDVNVRRWETFIHPRSITQSSLHPFVDQFGVYNGKLCVTAGWLTTQTLLQFKFVNNPLKLKSRLAGRLMNIKVTPVLLSFGGPELHVEDSSLSLDTVDMVMPAGVQVEVATLDNDPTICKLQPQEQFGREYKQDDILLVNITTSNHAALAYLLDFYSYSTRASSEDPPYHIGYTYVLPNVFKRSEGTLELPVTCNVKHLPLGTIVIEYLIINPMPTTGLCNMEVSYAKHWDPTWTGLEVGHRGLGASFKTKE